MGQIPLSVGVLVDLEWAPHAGGHVKCWERFAEAAAECSDQLDLTIYYLGSKRAEILIAPNVRYQLFPPLLGTNRIPIVRQRSRDTDLAPYDPRLARRLTQHQVLHTTSAFTFSRTARRVALRHRIPMVSSTHTDLPQFTRIYSREIINRLILKQPWLQHLLFERWQIQDHLAQQMQDQWCEVMSASDWVLISKEEDRELLRDCIPSDRISRLRRGINQQQFHPKHRDRQRLQAQFSIAPDIPVLLFVGRIDDSKKVMTLAQAARHLLDQGHALHVLAIGEGSAMTAVQTLLQAHATLPGVLPQTDLAWIYASADLFVFPSESEVSPNVVLEAKTSGLPVFVSARDGGAQFVQISGQDGVLVVSSDPGDWATTLLPYLTDRDRRTAMSQIARQSIEQHWPSWIDVLQADLLPIWQQVGQRVPG